MPSLKDDELIIIEGRVSVDDYSGGNRLSAIKVYDLMTFQSLKANLLKISLNGQADASMLKKLLKPYCDLDTTHKKCKVKIEYQKYELLLHKKRIAKRDLTILVTLLFSIG